MCETKTEKKVLAMYDVCGIQKYIFRTAKVKDAIGASRIIENIILEVLEAAVNKIQENNSVTAEFQWCNDEGAVLYSEEGQDIHVLFIGGGNAFVLYRNRKLCRMVSSLMARYTLEKTYSLQLAVAVIERSENYSNDYRELQTRMDEVQANMALSKPLGTLPVMEMEIKTGYPLISEEESTETLLKKKSGTEKQRHILEKEEKIFESYVTKKGTDSTIAVVHIDGNSMGQRIKEAVKDIEDYTEAVDTMRNISFHITHSYKKVFLDMKTYFDTGGRELKGLEEKEKPFMIREILVAGDDITFVCNGKAALAAVEYFCREITKLTMNGKNDEDSIRKYGFSVCAGIAYIGSHFPFSVGYEVAEECCRSAKKRAKNSENMDGKRVGNFVDFHICKNIQAQNFSYMRKREYQTSGGEKLYIRPYYISTKTEGNLSRLNKNYFAFNKLKEAIAHFQDEEKIPRSFAMEFRNTYSMGEGQVNRLYSFLESRGWKMPDGEEVLYWEDKDERIAKWYDALELADYYADLDEIAGGE